MGKGHKDRTVDLQAKRDNYDKIDWTKKGKKGKEKQQADGHDERIDPEQRS